MAITPCDVTVTNIQSLDNQPNDSGGMTAEQVKVLFDKAGADLKDYINNTLLPQLDANHIPYLQEGADTLKDAMDGIVLGQVPDGSITEEKLSDNAVTTDKIADSAITEEKLGFDVITPEDKATTEEAIAGEADDKFVTPKTAKEAILANSGQIGDVITTVRTDLGEKYLLCNGDLIDDSLYPDLALIAPIRYPDNGFDTTNRSFSGYCAGLTYVNGYYILATVSGQTATLYYSTSLSGTFLSKGITIYTNGSNISRVLFDGTHYIFVEYYSGTTFYVWYTTTTDINGTWAGAQKTPGIMNSFSVNTFTLLNGNFIIGGYYSGSNRPYIAYTTNILSSFTEIRINNSMTFGSIVQSIRYANGYYFFFSYQNATYFYTDSLFITDGWLYTSFSNSFLTDVMYDNGYYIFSGVYGPTSGVPYIRYGESPGSPTTIRQPGTDIWDSTGCVKLLKINGKYVLIQIGTVNSGKSATYGYYTDDITAPSQTWGLIHFEDSLIPFFDAIDFDGGFVVYANSRFYYIEGIGSTQVPTISETDAYAYIKALE